MNSAPSPGKKKDEFGGFWGEPYTPPKNTFFDPAKQPKLRRHRSISANPLEPEANVCAICGGPSTPRCNCPRCPGCANIIFNCICNDHDNDDHVTCDDCENCIDCGECDC